MGVVSYLAQMANIHAYKWGEASVLASLDYVRLLYATLFGYLFFDTLPGILTWIGARVIVAASIYTVRREAQRNQKHAASPPGPKITDNRAGATRWWCRSLRRWVIGSEQAPGGSVRLLACGFRP